MSCRRTVCAAGVAGGAARSWAASRVPSSSVASAPSIATFAGHGGAAPRPRAATRPRRRRPPGRHVIGSSSVEPPLSARACRLGVGGRSPGSRAYRPRLPGSRCDASGCGSGPRAVGFPGHSGGSAPDSHRLPCPPTWSERMLYPGRGMTVNLTRIYTRLGDGGETHLGDMSRVPKTHAADRGVRHGRRAQRAARRGARPGRAARARSCRGCSGCRTTCSTSGPTSRCRTAAIASGCGSRPSRPRGSSRPATRSTPSCRT